LRRTTSKVLVPMDPVDPKTVSVFMAGAVLPRVLANHIMLTAGGSNCRGRKSIG